MSDPYSFGQQMPNPMPPQTGGQQAMPPMMGQQDPMQMLAAMMPPPPVKNYDVKIKRCIKQGKIKIRIVPPEDFLIDPNAVKIDEKEGRFYADVKRMTRSEARLKWPDKKDVIDELPAYTTATDEGSEKQARDNRLWSFRQAQADDSTEEIEVTECYVQCDYDGDGVAEWRQVCVSGYAGETSILANEEWGGPIPFVSITPNPMPHRFRGRSIYDDVKQVQQIKTVLLRQMLDNLYLSNNPMMAVNASAIENKDALLNPEVGATIFTNTPPGDAIVPIAVPFTAEKVFPALEYWDMTLEKRTGVSRSSMALDTDTLQYQTATAVNAQQSAAHTKVEAYARNIAECGGFKRLFSNLLKLFVQNQKTTKLIKLREQFVPMDPHGWNAEMDVTINVGLGTGSRDRDIAVLQGVAQKQELAIQALQDPLNPILNFAHAFDTYRRMAEAAGLKNPEQFFPEFTQEQVMQIAQQKAQNPPPQPEQIKAQAQMQIEQMKMQGQQQSDAMRMQADQQLQAQKLQADMQKDQNKAQIDQLSAQQKAEIETIQAQADIETNRQKVANEMAIKEREFELKKELAILEFRLKEKEHQTKLVSMKMQAVNDRAKHEMEMEVEGDSGDDQRVEEKRKVDVDNERTEKLFAGVTDALAQLAASMSAPTQIVRDPKTGRVVGAQKRLN